MGSPGHWSRQPGREGRGWLLWDGTAPAEIKPVAQAQAVAILDRGLVGRIVLRGPCTSARSECPVTGGKLA
jgi:hypothetical protein